MRLATQEEVGSFKDAHDNIVRRTQCDLRHLLQGPSQRLKRTPQVCSILVFQRDRREHGSGPDFPYDSLQTGENQRSLLLPVPNIPTDRSYISVYPQSKGPPRPPKDHSLITHSRSLL